MSKQNRLSKQDYYKIIQDLRSFEMPTYFILEGGVCSYELTGDISCGIPAVDLYALKKGRHILIPKITGFKSKNRILENFIKYNDNGLEKILQPKKFHQKTWKEINKPFKDLIKKLKKKYGAENVNRAVRATLISQDAYYRSYLYWCHIWETCEL